MICPCAIVTSRTWVMAPQTIAAITNPDAVNNVATSKRGGRPSSNTSGRVSRRAISARLVNGANKVLRPPDRANNDIVKDISSDLRRRIFRADGSIRLWQRFVPALSPADHPTLLVRPSARSPDRPAAYDLGEMS